MSDAHFNLKSLASNSQEVKARAQQDGVADRASLTNVLGWLWDTTQGSLSLAKHFHPLMKFSQLRKLFYKICQKCLTH